MASYPISTAAIEHYAPAREQFEHLLGRLMDEETQALRHGDVESLVKTQGGELLRRMLQGYFDQRSAEEPIRERVVGKDGAVRPHRRNRSLCGGIPADFVIVHSATLAVVNAGGRGADSNKVSSPA